MKEKQLDALFQALAHSVRREILDIVKTTPGSSVSAVCEHFSMSRIAVMKHLGLLETAGMIVSEKSGRSRLLYFNIMPIQAIYDRWTDQYHSAWARSLSAFKKDLERKVAPHERKRKSHL